MLILTVNIAHQQGLRSPIHLKAHSHNLENLQQDDMEWTGWFRFGDPSHHKNIYQCRRWRTDINAHVQTILDFILGPSCHCCTLTWNSTRVKRRKDLNSIIGFSRIGKYSTDVQRQLYSPTTIGGKGCEFVSCTTPVNRNQIGSIRSIPVADGTGEYLFLVLDLQATMPVLAAAFLLLSPSAGDRPVKAMSQERPASVNKRTITDLTEADYESARELARRLNAAYRKYGLFETCPKDRGAYPSRFGQWAAGRSGIQ
jgi:hypothetical protein